MNLTRALIRERLGRPRDTSKYGDVAITEDFARAENVIPYDPRLHGATSFAPPLVQSGTFIQAAVLIPLVEHADGFTILLTQRMPGLKAHAGQISFPGGRMEPQDRDAEEGALREAEEEIGLAPASVEVLGRLDSYVTATGFEVMPVVGAVSPPLNLVKAPGEVADIFEVPLAFMLNRANHQLHSRLTDAGDKRIYYALPYGHRYIWGATAGMLVNLSKVLAAAP